MSRPHLHAWALLALCLVSAGCAGRSSRKPAARAAALERRVATAGAELLASLPDGADVVLELDVGRLRRNQVVGPAVRALSPWLRARAAATALPVDLALDADMIVAAVYGLARADAAMLVLVRGEAIDAAAIASAAASDTATVDEHTFAYGPPALRERLRTSARSVADDGELMRLRDAAMPTRAPGAVLRLTARLSTEARVTAANLLGYDGALPATISLWADVADDFALVALLESDSDADAQHLAADLEGLAKRSGRAFRIPLALRRVRATPSATTVRLVWTIGPKALEDGVARLQ